MFSGAEVGGEEQDLIVQGKVKWFGWRESLCIEEKS